MKRVLLVVGLFLSFAGMLRGQAVQSSTIGRDFAIANWTALSAVGNVTAVNVGVAIPKNHTLQVIVTGAPTACSVNLFGSLDGVNYFDISGPQTCTTGSIIFSVDAKPILFLRPAVGALSGGTAPTVQFSYAGIH